MNAVLLKILLAAAGRSAEQGTLFEIIATAVKLVHLIEPLLGSAADGAQTAETTAASERHDAP